MEVINFYGLTIVAGMMLLLVLGLLGIHSFGRSQSLDVMLLGQEFQTGLLCSAFFLNLLGGAHDEHGVHKETLLVFIIVLILHSFYYKILKAKPQYKVEAAITGIVLLMSASQFIVALDPQIELHMTRSYLGDIIVVSEMESIVTFILSALGLAALVLYRKDIFQDTLEASLFGRPTHIRNSQVVFPMVVLTIMLLSIHVFGILFTLAAILIPPFCSSWLSLPLRSYKWLTMVNLIVVPTAFFLIHWRDDIPTTILIVLLLTLTSLVTSTLLRLRGTSYL